MTAKKAPEKRGRGRPPSTEEKAKIEVRCLAEEKERWRKGAERADRDLSVIVRDFLNLQFPPRAS